MKRVKTTQTMNCTHVRTNEVCTHVQEKFSLTHARKNIFSQVKAEKQLVSNANRRMRQLKNVVMLCT